MLACDDVAMDKFLVRDCEVSEARCSGGMYFRGKRTNAILPAAHRADLTCGGSAMLGASFRALIPNIHGPGFPAPGGAVILPSIDVTGQ
jgi:hypothetical protein